MKQLRHWIRPYLRPLGYGGLALLPCAYFIFAAVQGDYGLFRRIQVEAEVASLSLQRDGLLAELALIENKTRRLSDDYLDLDLLDEQARDMLGLLRTDELVIR